MTDLVEKEARQEDMLPEWARWRGDAPAPAHWWARGPDGDLVKVYRSYADYVDD